MDEPSTLIGELFNIVDELINDCTEKQAILVDHDKNKIFGPILSNLEHAIQELNCYKDNHSASLRKYIDEEKKELFDPYELILKEIKYLQNITFNEINPIFSHFFYLKSLFEDEPPTISDIINDIKSREINKIDNYINTYGPLKSVTTTNYIFIVLLLTKIEEIKGNLSNATTDEKFEEVIEEYFKLEQDLKAIDNSVASNKSRKISYLDTSKKKTLYQNYNRN